jgi:hypothetical protein
MLGMNDECEEAVSNQESNQRLDFPKTLIFRDDEKKQAESRPQKTSPLATH